MVAVQELLFKRLFHPHFVLGIGSQIVQGSNVEFQFVRLGEFTKTGTNTNQLLVAKAFGQLQDFLRHIVNTIQVFPEAVCTIGTVNQLFHVGANAARELENKNIDSLHRKECGVEYLLFRQFLE